MKSLDSHDWENTCTLGTNCRNGLRYRVVCVH